MTQVMTRKNKTILELVEEGDLSSYSNGIELFLNDYIAFDEYGETLGDDWKDEYDLDKALESLTDEQLDSTIEWCEWKLGK